MLFALVLLVALLPVRPVQAAPILRLVVELTPGTPSPVPSGVAYRYRLTYECSSSRAGDTCENMVVTSQLSPDLEFVQVIGNADVRSASYSPASGLATWAFKSPLPLGTTGQFEFELRYKPGSTLDGERGTVTSTISAGSTTVTPPAVTAPPAAAADQSSVTKTLVSGGAAGGLSTYEIRVCAGSSGALNLGDISVVDTLPAGAELVATSPPHTGFADGVLTWADAGDVVVPGCRSFSVTVRYSGPDNPAGAVKQNSAAVTGTPAGGVEKTITTDLTHTLVAPAPALALEKSADADTVVGGAVTTRLRAANTGNVPLADVVVEDPIPAAQNVVSFTPGGATAVAYQKNGDAAWLAVPGPLPATVVAADLPGFAAGDYISRLRFSLGALDEPGTPAPARVADTVTISATAINPPHGGSAYALPSTVTNTATASAAWAGGALRDVADGASTLVDVPKARPAPQKSIVSGSPALPGGAVRYRLRMANGSFAPLDEPVFGDLLPAELAFDNGVAPTVVGIAGCAAPAFSKTDDFAGSGRTLLVWSYAGSGCAIPSGGAVTVEFAATVRNTTYPAAAIANRLALLDFSTPTSLVRRTSCAAAPDVQAILAQRYDPARLCFSPAAPLKVNAAASIASAKLVRGQLDGQFHRDPRVGATVRGGLITYSVALTNTGNVDFRGLEVVDVLPYYNAGPPVEQNLGVRDLAALGTRWTPRLTGPVEISPAIPGLQVRYSGELNPCRPGLASNNPGCTPMADGAAPGPGVWSTQLPSDPTAVRSLKFVFPADYVLAAAATVRFTFAMYAPEDAPFAGPGENGVLGDNDDLDVAWNTFAYQAVRADDGTRLVAQPPRVGIEVVPVPPGLAAYGNYVWNDVDHQGDQDEPPALGINGVTVRLFRRAGGVDELVGTQITRDDAAGRPGFYLFPALQPGDYFAEVVAPTGFALTTPDAAAPGDAADSDADPATGRTAVTTLSRDESDRGWDAGVYAPVVSLGSRVWFDADNDGRDDDGASAAPGSSAGVPGVAVQLFLDENGDGALTGRERVAIAEDVSDAAGRYEFRQRTRDNTAVPPADLGAAPQPLYPGQYIVGIPAANFAAGGALAGYHSSGTTLGPGGAIVELPAPDPDTGADPADPADDDRDDDDNGDTVRDSARFYYRGVLGKPVFVGAGEPTGEPEPRGDAPAEPPIPVPDDRSNFTVDFGFYAVGLGDRVWVDDGAGGAQADDGLRSAGESGLAGVRVRLFDSTNTAEIPVGTDGVLGTADDATGGVLTAAGGGYSFAGLPQGSYRVRAELPAGYASTRDTARSAAPDANQDDDDNVVGIGTGLVVTPPLTVPAGADATRAARVVTPAKGLTYDPSLDVGVVRHYSLGNRVWIDLNNNGRLDAGEPSPPGNVTVRLLRGDGLTPATNIAGASVASAVTSNGTYRFDKLPAGDYVVELANSNFSSAGAALYGYRSSTGAAGASEPGPDPDTDAADNDDNGTSVANGTPAVFTDDVVRSAPVTLGEGTGAEEPAGGADADGGAIAAAEAPDSQSNRSVDFGLYPLYSVGNRVWDDRNNDGLLSAGEGGVDGVVVNLYRAGDLSAPLAAVTTAGGGYYLFTGLTDAADYVVELPASNFAAGAPLAGFLSSTGNSSAGVDPFEPAPDPDANAADGDDNGTAGGGIRAPAVTISYLGEPTSEAATAGFVDQARNSNSNLGVDFGLFQPLSLGNRVWNDRDDDGRVDAGEPGIDGVGVRLFRDDDAVPGTPDGPAIRSVTTAGGGYYLFAGLGQGDYIVEVDTPATMTSSTGLMPPFAYEPARDPDTGAADGDDDGTLAGAVTRSAPVTLAAGGEPLAEGDVAAPADNTPDGSANLTVDFGFYAPLSLGNLVWLDADDDGVVSQGDGPAPGLAGRAVRLYQDADDDGVPDDLSGDGAIGPADALRSTATSATGHYLFTGLGAGTYIVEVAAQPGERSSTGAPPELAYEPPADADASPVDSDDNGLDGDLAVRSRPVTLAAGDEPAGEPATPGIADSAADASANYTLDFGLFTPVSLGDLVFEDAGNDGVFRAPDDTPLPGATLRLLAADGATPAVDADGEPLAEQTTGADGRYLFANLRPGRYVVAVVAPAGYRSSTDIATSASPDGDVNGDDNGVGDQGTARSEPVTLTSGGEPADDGDGDTTSNLSVDFGLYRPAAIGDRVWLDRDANGVQDEGEPGVPGVGVTLLDGAGRPLAATTTDEAGLYAFPPLGSGDYSVRFTPPDGFRFSPARQGDNPGADSDADPATGDTPGTTLGPGEADPTWDAGLYTPVGLGNLVWDDLDDDGRLGADERGIPGVAVRLYADGAPDGAALAVTTTDEAGRYGFAGLTPGRYLVEIATPDGYRSSTGTPGAAAGPYEPAPHPDGDVDSDDDGTAAGAGSVRSGAVTVWSRSEPTADGDDADANQSVDFGLFRPAALGSTVWLDGDGDGRQGAGEPGVPGVLASLYRGDGAPVRDEAGRPITVTTDAKGIYLFENLAPGSYRVRFSNLPDGYSFTLPGVGDDDGDSDADPRSGMTPIVTLTAGETQLSLWAGLVITPTAVTLTGFSAERGADGVALRWTTGAELNSVGFHILRSAAGERAGAERITAEPILARGGPQQGAAYTWIDRGAAPGVRYTYWLEELERGGGRNEYGPVEAAGSLKDGPARVYLPLLAR